MATHSIALGGDAMAAWRVRSWFEGDERGAYARGRFTWSPWCRSAVNGAMYGVRFSIAHGHAEMFAYTSREDKEGRLVEAWNHGEIVTGEVFPPPREWTSNLKHSRTRERK